MGKIIWTKDATVFKQLWYVLFGISPAGGACVIWTHDEKVVT